VDNEIKIDWFERTLFENGMSREDAWRTTIYFAKQANSMDHFPTVLLEDCLSDYKRAKTKFKNWEQPNEIPNEF
jgi:hypothetical protein